MARDKKPSREVESILTRARDAFAYTTRERAKFMLAVSFVDGEQWVSPVPGENRLQPVNMSRYDGDEFPTVSDNEIGPAVRARHGQVGTKLEFEALPMGSDSASRSAARLAERICYHTADEHAWQQLDEELLLAMDTGGAAAIVQMWNPRAGTGLGVDRNGREFGTGDLEYFVADIGEFAVAPGRHVPEKAPWWVYQRALTPAEAKARYNLAEEPAADATAATFSARLDNGTAATNMCRVVTMFERPSAVSRKGRVVTVIGNEIVEDTPWPFPYSDSLNISVGRPHPKHRRWTGHSPVWDAIPNQTQLNWFESYRMAHLRDAANAERIVDETYIDEARPGPRTIPFTPDPNGGFMPKLMDTWQMPEYAREFGPEQRELVRSKVGVSDMALGDLPTGVSAASAFAVIIEQGEKRQTPLVKARAHVWSDVATKTLKTYEAKVVGGEKREVRLVDGDHVRTIAWDGAMLLGHTKVTVPVDRIMPRNRAASVALADTLMQAGQIADARKYLELAEVGDTDHALGVLSPDWERARRENHLLAAGKAAVVEPWDDDAIHIEAHTAEFKSARWDEMSEEAKQLAREHLQGHETQAAEKAGRMRQQAQMDPALAAAPQVARPHEGVVEAVGGPSPVAGELGGPDAGLLPVAPTPEGMPGPDAGVLPDATGFAP